MSNHSKINNTLYLIFGQGLNFVFNLLMLPFLVRQLSFDDYGTYSQVLLVISTFTPIIGLGLSNSLTIFFNDKEKHNHTILCTSAVLIIITTIISYILLITFQGSLAQFVKNEFIWHYLKYFFFSIIFQQFSDLLYIYFVYINKVKHITLFLVVSNTIRLLFLFVAINFYKDIDIILIALFATSVIQFLMYLIKLIQTDQKLHLHFNFQLSKELIKYALPLSLTGIVGILLIQTDGYVVTTFLGKNNFSIYRTGAIEIPFLTTIYASISTILLPSIKKHIEHHEFSQIVELKRIIAFNTALLIYPLILTILFCSQELIEAYLGINFSKSSEVFVAYNLILFLRVNDYMDVLILNKKSGFILKVFTAAFVLNLVISIVLVHVIGIIGPCIATFISILFIAILQLRETSSLLNTKALYLINFKKIFTLLCLESVILYLFIYIFNLNYSFLVKGTFMVIYLATHYFVIVKYKVLDTAILFKIENIFVNGLRKFLLR